MGWLDVNGRKRLVAASCIVLAVAAGIAVHSAMPGGSPATGLPLERALPERNPDLSQISLRIEKSAYRLTVFYRGKSVKTYPVVFGPNPVDDKIREGDHCTPEGEFKLIGHREHKWWSRFLWVGYPTEASRKRFRAAKAAGKLSKSATIGGQIGIHGVPEGHDDWIDKRINWTAGCISLKTADILELYRFTRVGTPVTIVH